MTEIIEELIDIFGIDIERLVQVRGQVGHVGERAAQLGDRLTHIGAIFSDERINVIDGLVGFLGGLAKIRKQRLKLFADGIDVLEGGTDERAILLDHSARIGEGC